jgi:hypothetical protein
MPEQNQKMKRHLKTANNSPIGFSSGTFYSASMNMELALHCNNAIGANAFEFSFLSLDELASFDETSIHRWQNLLQAVLFRSIHAPVKGT